jgi:hypothetical protein
MATVVLSGDEVLNGAREITTRKMVCSQTLRASCSSVKVQPELVDPSVTFWARRGAVNTEGSGSQNPYQEVRQNEADPMAK